MSFKYTFIIQPNAKKTEAIQEANGIKIKLNSPATEGKANKELIEFLSKKFKIPKSKIELVKGFKSRTKVIELENEVDLKLLF